MAIELFHVREGHLDPGSIIQPGRWGFIVIAEGKSHPFFFREHLLEIWRLLRTNVQVSRLACCFAHESLEQARTYANSGESILRVEPTDPTAPKSRLDMLWLTWMGESGATTEKLMSWAAGYWSGGSTADLKPNAQPSWEWLFACPLRVLE